MPNWSYNNLTVSGQKNDLQEFYAESLKTNENGELTFKFSNVFPIPEKIKNTISPSSSAKGRHRVAIRDNKISETLGVEPEIKLTPCENNSDEKCALLRKEFGTDNWYDWNIMNYGTKWDVEVQPDSYEKHDEEFYCNFDTAWSPPETFLSRLQEKFPKLNIRLTYDLEGSDTCGIFETCRTGEDVYIEHSEEEAEYKSDDGRNIYFSTTDHEWHYEDDDEVCYDVVKLNPFN